MLMENMKGIDAQSGDELECENAFEYGRATQLRSRLAGARHAFTTRNVNMDCAAQLDRKASPEVGDLVLARVVAIGHHTKLESPEGRRQQMYVGDERVLKHFLRAAVPIMV